MASRNMVVGTGAALAGVGGLAAAAITANPPVTKTQVKTIAQPVETRTVVVRRVEHRVRRLKPKPLQPHVSAAATPVVAASAPVAAAAPVVQYAPATTPVRTRTSGSTHTTAPVRTRTSGAAGGGGEAGDARENGDD